MGGAYYNEHDRFCASWLRNLIGAGLIAAGDVDERDIRDVVPADLDGYTQVHLFAGIGLWSAALRLAGWSDDRPVWTASCPCQPFSQAGGRGGVFDDRHLWPAAQWLIAQQRPVAIFGEQVASVDGAAWLDIVSADLEAHRYRVGAVAFCSAGVGAPNIRQRLWWVADTDEPGRGLERGPQLTGQCSAPGPDADGRLASGGLADAATGGRRSWSAAAGRETWTSARTGDGSASGGLADTDLTLGEGRGGGERNAQRAGLGRGGRSGHGGELGDGAFGGLGDPEFEGLPDPGAPLLPGAGRWGEGREPQPPSGAPSSWRDPEWIDCRDGKWRPAQPGISPLAARHPGDVAKLRAYGNAINPVAAAAFIRAYLDLQP